MVKEAAEHEADDKSQREQVERRNRLDNLCYSVETTLRDDRSKMEAADASSLDGIVQEARKAIESQVTVSSLPSPTVSEGIAPRRGDEEAGGCGRRDDAGERRRAPEGERRPWAENVVDAEFEDAPPGHP